MGGIWIWDRLEYYVNKPQPQATTYSVIVSGLVHLVHNVENDTHEKEQTANPIYDHEVITLSPVQEENFRQNLDDLLQQLDTETKNFENKEKEKIARLEDKKALYLQRADEMGKKNKGKSDNRMATTIQN